MKLIDLVNLCGDGAYTLEIMEFKGRKRLDVWNGKAEDFTKDAGFGNRRVLSFDAEGGFGGLIHIILDTGRITDEELRVYLGREMKKHHELSLEESAKGFVSDTMAYDKKGEDWVFFGGHDLRARFEDGYASGLSEALCMLNQK